MEINNELLSKILSGDSTCKVTVLKWRIDNDIYLQSNNHTSELSRLTVEYQRKGKTFKKSFILKVPSTHPLYDLGKKFKMYEKEYPIYTEVLEEMYKMDGEHIGAKLYYSDDKYSLMMKDLTSSGYKTVNKTEQLDFHQCYMVLRSLAKFHALSVKLDRHSKISPAMKRIPWLGEPELQQLCQDYMSYGCDQLAQSVDPKFELDQKIHAIKNDLFAKSLEEIVSPQFAFKVLTHGDLWLGNTLFKFNKYGHATKVKLVDFQCVSWSSPVFDVMCFTITSMRFDVFEKHFDFLTQIYIETLNEILRFYQCDTYSLAEFRHDLDKLRGTIIMIMCCQLPQVLSCPEYPMDYQRYIINGKVDVRLYEKLFQNEAYKKVLNQWVSYYVKKGLFDWK